jgi:hypothetical protein
MFNDDILWWQRRETVLNFHVHKPNGTEDAANDWLTFCCYVVCSQETARHASDRDD